MFKLLGEVFSTILVSVSDTCVTTFEHILHALLSFFALRWMRWLWVITTIKSSMLKDFHQFFEAFISTIPVTIHGLVEHVFSNVLGMLPVSFAISSKIAGFFESWDFSDHIFQFCFSILGLLGFDSFTE